MAERAHVRNAADPKQVNAAGRRVAKRESRYSTALAAVMQTAEGRIVMWGLLERAGIFRSIWDASAKIHYNAGRQDFGHELQANLIAADERAYELMEREARAFARGEDREAEAVQTRAATEEAESDG